MITTNRERKRYDFSLIPLLNSINNSKDRENRVYRIILLIIYLVLASKKFVIDISLLLSNSFKKEPYDSIIFPSLNFK